jgi:hypothetical protein
MRCARDGRRPGRPRRSWITALCAATTALVLGATTATASAADPAPTRAWVDRALDLQHHLADDVPLRDAPWLSTHNSYNRPSLALATLDPNQTLDLTGQLDAGVRHLEIDVHPPLAPLPLLDQPATVCHTVCTLERPLEAHLTELTRWLDRHPAEVVLLYLESHLEGRGGSTGYDAGAAVLERTLGRRVLRPEGPPGTCRPMPLELTRAQIHAAGRQLLLIGPCGVGSRWSSWVFDEEPRITAGDNAALRDAPDCGPEVTRAQYDAHPVRYYEDLTMLGAATGTGHTRMSPALVARMLRCGVDIVGFDHLLRDDARRTAFVWSWAPGQPAAGDCAAQRPDGRWTTRPCTDALRAACRAADGRWSASPVALPAASAARGCREAGGTAVPRTGRDGHLLREAAAAAGDVWLGLRRAGDRWVPDERAGCGPTLTAPARRWRVRDGVARIRVGLRFACTGEPLRARFRVLGGRRSVLGTTGRTLRVRVGPRTRSLVVRVAADDAVHRLRVRLRR